MITRGRLPEFRGSFEGLGLAPAPAMTPMYIPPGATYASFPGIDGIWRVYSGSRPIALLEFSAVSGALAGKIKFLDNIIKDVPNIRDSKIGLFVVYPVNQWLNLYRVSLDFEKNKLIFRIYANPFGVKGTTFSKIDAEASIVGNQLIGKFNIEISEEAIEVPAPPTSFYGQEPLLESTRWWGNPVISQIYWNAIKESQPAFVPALVVIRSPTPGVTMEVTVPVITVPLTPSALPPSQTILPAPSAYTEPAGTRLVETSRDIEELHPEVSSVLKAGMPPLAWVAIIGVGLGILFGTSKKG